MKSESASTPLSARSPTTVEVGAGTIPKVLSIVVFAAITAAGARIAVPLPGTAVPFTLQVVAVLLAGFLLGPRLGAASQVLYVGAGAAGLPVFAAGGGAAYLLGPTGGYLLVYPIAAALAGYVAERWRGLPGLAVAGLVGLGVIHLGGSAWLAVMVGPDAAIATGVLPFLPGDFLKLALAAALTVRLRKPVRRYLG